MNKVKQIIDLRSQGWTYRRIGKKIGMAPRLVLERWWKSHLTDKELRAYRDQVNLLTREKHRILREVAEKKGLLVRFRSKKK